LRHDAHVRFHIAATFTGCACDPSPKLIASGIGAGFLLFLIAKARRLARKWGGQCIIFIDEIDAVGRRRSGVAASMAPPSLEDFLFFGPHGALNPSGDMILETRAWRDKLFASRAPERGLRVRSCSASSTRASPAG